MPPEGFPNNTLPAQRALCALQLSQPAALPDAIAALYQAFWVERKQIQQVEVVFEALAAVIGEEEARKALEQTAKQEVKDLLLKNTDIAFASGAFGLPWFEGAYLRAATFLAIKGSNHAVATNSNGETEGFWGFDHLGQVADHLGLERPTNGGWKSML